MSILNNDPYNRPENEQVALDAVIKVHDASSVNIQAQFRLANGQKMLGVLSVPRHMLIAGQGSVHAVLLVVKGMFETSEGLNTRCEELGFSLPVERPGQSKKEQE